MNLPGDLSSSAYARESIRLTLGEWGMVDLLDETEIIASELVTNAVRHGAGPITLHLAAPADRSSLRVGVHDSDGTRVPLPRSASPRDTGGRGMQLIDSLAARWGCQVDGTGKEVWAVLAR